MNYEVLVIVFRLIDVYKRQTFNITIPQKSLDEISKIIERDEMIEMYVSDRKVLYVFDNNIIQTRLIDGTFPDTNRDVYKRQILCIYLPSC